MTATRPIRNSDTIRSMLILAAILAIFVYGMIAAMLGTILPDLSARFHLTPSQLGQIAFTQALGLILRPSAWVR